MTRRLVIAVCAGLCAAGAAGAAGWVGVDRGVASAREAAGQGLSDAAGRLARALDSGMHAHWAEILDLAGRDVPGTDAAAQRARRDAINQVKGRHPEWAWIGYAAPEGTVTASTDGVLEGASVAGRPWFDRGLSAPVVLDLHEARMLARFLRRDGEAPPRLIDIAAPRGGAGAANGVLGGHLSWAWGRGVERAVRAEATLPPGTQLLVVSSAGEVVLGPDGAETRLDVRDAPWIDGAGRLSAAAPTRGEGDYPGLGWVAVARSDAGAEAGWARNGRLLALAAAVLAGLAAGVAAFRRMRPPA